VFLSVSFYSSLFLKLQIKNRKLLQKGRKFAVPPLFRQDDSMMLLLPLFVRNVDRRLILLISDESSVK
jgi:hypothetical protein